MNPPPGIAPLGAAGGGNGPLAPGDARRLAMGLGALRASIGLVALAAPSVARLWVGHVAATSPGRTLSRSLAARDLGLGAGVLLAAGDQPRLRTWVALGAFGDLVDGLGTLAGRGLPRVSRLLVGATSLGAAAAGAAAAISLPGRPAPTC